MRKLSALFLLTVVLMSALVLPIHAADRIEGSESFDITTSDVLEDLKRTYINGLRFYEEDYPIEENADYMLLLNVVEYAYKEYAEGEDPSAYGLYFYVYNPSGDSPMTEDVGTIQMSYGGLINYRKISLRLLDESDDHRFLKLTLDTDMIKILSSVKSDARIYRFSGIELNTKAKGLVDYNIAGTYTFTGLQSENNLFCSTDTLTTLELELHSTFFRTLSSEKGAGYQNQLDSVYFALDNSIMNRFGKVHSIRAVYDEFRISGIVTNNDSVYTALLPYVVAGKKLSDYEGYNETFNSLSGLSLQIFSNMNSIHPPSALDFVPDWGWNTFAYDKKLLFSSVFLVDDIDDRVYSEDITAFKDKYGISDKSYLYFEDPSMVLPPASLLFKKDVTLTVEDSFEMLSYDSNHNLLEKILEYGLFTGALDDTYTNIKAIVDVTSSDLEVTPAEISENLLVDETDVAELISVVRAAEASNQTVYLFRFDVQDYYQEEVCSIYDTDSLDGPVVGYYFEQNYYQDFDVMEIAFRDNHNRITILPVTMTPIDVVGDATGPVDLPTVFDDFRDWLDGLGQNNPDNPFWRILAIILGVLLVVVIVILIVKSVNSQKSSSSHASRRRKRR